MKFIDFAKRAKMYLILFSVLLLVIVGSVIYGLVTQYDRGFLIDGGRAYYYDKLDFPLQFAYTKDVPLNYLSMFVTVIDQLNDRLGFKLIKNTMIVWDKNLDGIDSTINVLIEMKELSELSTNCGGTTIIHSNTKNDGKILSVHIKMRSGLTGNNLETAIRHEIGHVLCLDHDDKKSSVMYEYTEGRLKYFTSKDIERLRKRYRK